MGLWDCEIGRLWDFCILDMNKTKGRRGQGQGVPGTSGPQCDSEVWLEVIMKRNGDMKYEIIMYWSGEDKAFVAEIPELPGCIAHGDTEEKALKSVKEAARLWVDVAKEFGDAVPQPKGKRLMLA